MHRGALDQVVVVDDDNECLTELAEFVDELGHDHEFVSITPDNDGLHFGDDARVNLPDGLDQVEPKSARVGVTRLHLQPRNGVRTLGQSRCEKRRFARPGSRAREHQADVVVDSRIENLVEPRTANEPIGQDGRTQLRRRQADLPLVFHLGILRPESIEQRMVPTDLTRVRSAIERCAPTPLAARVEVCQSQPSTK